jgi:alpha-tubulin suppressor-like RCC1 family protein
MSGNFIFDDNGTPTSFDDVFVSARKFQQGSLWSWGLNNFGQLGISTGGAPDFSRSIPITVSSSAPQWKEVCAGTYGGFGLSSNGQLSVWGSNIYGLLGINNASTGNLYGATLYNSDTNWKSLANGAAESMAAIKTDGSLWVWGRNERFQLGTNDNFDRSTPATTFAGGNNWKQVSMGWKFTAAIKTDGSLWVWGSNSYARLGIGTVSYPDPDIVASTPITTFAGGNDWKSVSCGLDHALALKNDGSLWAWGLNAYGACGVGADPGSVFFITIPTQVEPSFTWKTADAGRYFSAGIKDNGSLWTWGRNSYGQLGIARTETDIVASDPSAVYGQDLGNNFGSSNWKDVKCGGSTVIAVKSDGTVWGWGKNDAGQIGLGTTDNVTISIPTQIPIGDGWRTVSTGAFSNFTLALKYDGTTLFP